MEIVQTTDDEDGSTRVGRRPAARYSKLCLLVQGADRHTRQVLDVESAASFCEAMLTPTRFGHDVVGNMSLFALSLLERIMELRRWGVDLPADAVQFPDWLNGRAPAQRRYFEKRFGSIVPDMERAMVADMKQLFREFFGSFCSDPSYVQAMLLVSDAASIPDPMRWALNEDGSERRTTTALRVLGQLSGQLQFEAVGDITRPSLPIVEDEVGELVAAALPQINKSLVAVDPGLPRKLIGAVERLQLGGMDSVSQAANSGVEAIDRYLRAVAPKESERVIAWCQAQQRSDLLYEQDSKRFATKRSQFWFVILGTAFAYQGATLGRMGEPASLAEAEAGFEGQLVKAAIRIRESLQRLKHSDKDTADEREVLRRLLLGLQAVFYCLLHGAKASALTAEQENKIDELVEEAKASLSQPIRNPWV